MKLIPKRAFLNWTARHGIGRDLKIREYYDFIYPDVSQYRRFWLPGPRVNDLLNFINAALHAATEEGTFYFFRRAWGIWHYGVNGSIRDLIIDRMLAPLNVPHDFRGALKLEAAEWADILTIITAHYVFGWSVNQDLYIIPDDAGSVLMVSHHGHLRGAFPSEERLRLFENAMASRGYPLPDHVPDDSFNIPPWMESGANA